MAALVMLMPSRFGRLLGASAGSLVEAGLATGPACPSWAETAAPAPCTASASRRSPGIASGRIQSCRRSVLPSGLTAQYATVVIATPPSANARWKSMSASDTSACGVRPSNVAALMILLRNRSGPSLAGANTSFMPPTLAKQALGRKRTASHLGVRCSTRGVAVAA
ncbi:hypothetical protein GCM10020001_022900 [Nonomuraea salmonea]